MTKPLIVVESPTKVRTIQKYLGNTYNVVATVGHIRDLPERELGIDIEAGFVPKYITIPGKQNVIKKLRQASDNAGDVYLAPDPDREGEAIAWHTSDVLKKQGRRFHRVLFHELTRNAVIEAIQKPLALNRPKYEAQQARRILDRLVGYQISPLLWRKVKGGLSAGRVQSVAVRIICERERAIQAFVPEEYWSVTAHLAGDTPPPFQAKLSRENGKKIHIGNEETARTVLEKLEGKPFVVKKVQKKTTHRNPQPPFITSKLQQEAIHKLRFTARKTMIVAQQLYEGVDIGPGEPEGLITYMRTDSTRISNEAALEALELIRERFGAGFAPDKPRVFTNRKKAQDAHEAIRPTSVYNTPEKMARFLSDEQMALYRLIWQRFVASQMMPALIDQNTVTISAGTFDFLASGSSIRFPGFMELYMTVDEETERKSEDQKEALPPLTEGMVLTLNKIDPKQHFTLPPPRFSEASLVKELEENGIGRPSTYAAILSTIRGKGYVDLVKGYFRPSELGFIVNDLLVKNFPDVFDVEFTAKLEDSLDRVETADADAAELLSGFYTPFRRELEQAAEGMLSMRGVGMPAGLSCPECNQGQLHIKVGKNGEYLACNRYPDCRYTRNYSRNEKGVIEPDAPTEERPSDAVCDKCGRPMILKSGRYGEFLACSGYPECKTTRSVNAAGTAKSTGVRCPETACTGEIVEKTSRRGKVFYGCSRYPECTFAVWDPPVNRPCPKCGAAFLLSKSTKKAGTFLTCLAKDCGFREKV